MSSDGVVVIGNGPVSKALLRTLRLFSDSAPLIDPEMIKVAAARVVQDDLPENLAQMANDLMDCRLAVAVAEGSDAARQIINLLRVLREHWLADAGFVALVDSKTELERLISWDVFGDPSGRFTFQRELKKGHEALCIPFSLPNLLQKVLHPNLLPSPNVWKLKWASQSLASKTSFLLDEAENCLRSGEVPGARDKFLTAVSQARELHWNALVDHVCYRKQVEPFLKRSFGDGVDAPELGSSIAKLRHLVCSGAKGERT